MRRSIFGVGVVLLGALAAGPAAAQTLAPPQERPSNGLFGRAPVTDQSLDLAFSFSGAYDDNIAAAEPTMLGDPYAQQSGSHEQARASLSYARTFRQASIGLAWGSAGQYYPTMGRLMTVQHGGSAGFSAQFGSTHVTASGNGSYAPYFAFGGAPALFDARLTDLPAASPDFAVLHSEMRAYGGNVGITQQFGRRFEAAAQGTYRDTQLVRQPVSYQDSTAWARLTYHLTRDLGLVAGYTLQQGTYHLMTGQTANVQARNANFGLDYSRSLSPTRRTTIGFTTGTAAVDDMPGSMQYRVIGSVRVNREIGRTWHATGTFSRGASVVPGFRQTFFGDSIAAGLGGHASPRLEMSVLASYTKGQFGAVVNGNNNVSYNANGSLRYALSKRTALFGEYVFYTYSFDNGVLLPTEFPQRLDRQGVRVGLDVWLPLAR